MVNGRPIKGGSSEEAKEDEVANKNSDQGEKQNRKDRGQQSY